MKGSAALGSGFRPVEEAWTSLHGSARVTKPTHLPGAVANLLWPRHLGDQEVGAATAQAGEISMDALALPTLGVLLIVFIVYIWNSWLKNKEDRAINVDEDDDDAASS